ncbi:adenylate kinase isoenzyme 5-like isoform X1 [Convolutriloba macropyga]|uniref:adenylate kinase isoenzyme 5-like isoform X1 n=1 Tax=Convolutriloba macropyga TaxID=536237 RepID=UPI003F51BBFD
MDPLKSTTTDSEAKSYLAEKEIPQLFESMLTGLMYSRPEDPLGYLEECINKSKEAGVENIMWDTFALKRDPLPPITPTPREKSFITQHSPTQEADESRHPHTDHSAPSNNPALNPYQALPPIGGNQAANGSSEQQEEVEESTIVATSSNLLGILSGTVPTQLKRAYDPKFCIFIGTVGSGKESHFSELEYDMGMVTVRLGDLIEKEAAKEDSELGDKIKDLVNLGEEIPDSISLQLIKTEVSSVDAGSGYVIDGFPRSVEALAEFESQIGEISKAFFFEQSEDELHSSIEQTTHDAQDANNFLEISGPIVAHFEQLGKVVKISSVSSGTEQMDLIKSALAEVGVRSAGAGGGDSQEVEEDEVIPEHDIGFIPASDDSIPQSALVGTSFVSLLGSATADSSQLVSYLQESHGFSLLRVSDILSQEALSQTTLGQALKTTMLQGQDIPHDLALAAILGAVIKNASSEKIILEGFPRSEEQLDKFEKTVSSFESIIYVSILC